MSTTSLTSVDIGSVIDTRSVRVVFQPIFDLRTMQVVGMEAFARGPAGTDLESPGALFSQAAAVGRVAELDWVCRAAAFRAVLEAGLPPSLSVFVNAEPESLGPECPADLRADIGRAEAQLRVFVEVNDNALVADPAGLVAAVDRARSMGWGVAVDDVGARRGTVVLLPVLHADVVKIVVGLLQNASPFDSAALVTSALRHAERTGAAICVERIESEESLTWAQAIGATYGQGNHLAPPGPLPDVVAAPRVPVPLVAPSTGDVPVASPLGLLPDLEPRRVERLSFLDLARMVAFGTIATGAAPVVLVNLGRHPLDREFSASFPDAVTPVLYVLFGTEVSGESPPGMRFVRLDRGDSWADVEFSVQINEKGGSALIGETLPDGALERYLTQDVEVVHAIVRHIVRRVPPSGGDNLALPLPVFDPVEDDELTQDAGEDVSADAGRRGIFGRRR